MIQRYTIEAGTWVYMDTYMIMLNPSIQFLQITWTMTETNRVLFNHAYLFMLTYILNLYVHNQY